MPELHFIPNDKFIPFIMKYFTTKINLALLLLLGFLAAGCEKDDICDPAVSTTPRLLLQFYDKNNRTLTRPSTNLKLVGEDMDDSNPLPNRNGRAVWNDTLVSVPLRIDQNSTTYKLILNADDNNTTNDVIDFITFNYTRNDVYVSRACGFKTLFNLFGNPLEEPFEVNNIPGNTLGNWINDVEVLQSQINDENETHIKIYF